MKKLGIYNIDWLGFGEKEESPIGAYGKAREKSAGKTDRKWKSSMDEVE